MENSTARFNGTNATTEQTEDVIVFFSINTIGLALNVLVIAVVVLRPCIQSNISRMLVVSQCATDAIGALLSAIVLMSDADPRVPENVFGDLICHVWWTHFLEWIFIQASVNNVMLFTIERYLSIVRPLTHQRLSAGLTFFAIVVSFLMAVVMNVVLWFDGERSGDHCVELFIAPTPFAVEGAVTLLIYAFPIVLLIGLYSRMIVVLKRQNQRLRGSRRNRSQGEVSRDLTVIVAIAATAYTLLFAPVSFIYALYTFNVTQIDTERWVVRLYTGLVNINFIVNPFIFVVFLRSFRRELRRLFSPALRSSDTFQSQSNRY